MQRREFRARAEGCPVFVMTLLLAVRRGVPPRLPQRSTPDSTNLETDRP